MHQKTNLFFKLFFLTISLVFIATFSISLYSKNKQSVENNTIINPLYETSKIIPDEIESLCNGIGYSSYNNLSFSDINNIEIDYLDREKWFTNLFYLSLNEGRAISSEFKDTYQAHIKVNYKNEYFCTFKAEVRISGDWNDHVDKINLVASMDIKLLDGNILGITKFKLFLPKTRNGDNEIFTTVLLNQLGFLSPRSFYVNVQYRNHNNDQSIYKFIFQEKLSKEMIEFNGYREAPLLETNETFYWDEVINNKLNLSKGIPLMFAKSLNSYWARKGTPQSIITIEGLEQFNKSIFNSYNPYTQLNYSYLGEEQNIFYMFDAANIALLAEHGITNHQRKFLYNKLENQFYPVYYDGNSNFIELGHIRWRNDYEELENLSKGAKNLLENLNLNVEILHNKLNEHNLDYDLETTRNLISKFLNNLEIISNGESTVKPNYKNTLENINQINFPKSFKLIFVDQKNNLYESCTYSLSDCDSIDLNNGTEYTYSNKIKTANSDGYIFGKSKESFINSQNIKEDRKFLLLDNAELEVFGSPNIILDYSKKTLEVYLDKENQKIKIFGPGYLENWEIKISSVVIESDTKIRLDENLLTGCLTFYDLEISNLNIELNNLHCEDAINIVRSNGTIKNLKIKDAHSDGLDIDFSNIAIENLHVNSSLNDCLDLSAGVYKIQNFEARNCYDKAISVGEKAIVDLNKIKINNSNIGIAVKDSSRVSIKSSFVENVDLCYAVYRKKQEFGPSMLSISEMSCNSKTNFIQNGSEVNIGK